MDWNLKTPSWDLSEFEQETSSNISPVSESSSFGGQGIKGEFSVDLKLGHVVNGGNESEDNLPALSAPKMALSPPGSSKRARAVNNGIQTASCLVDGCRADLSSCRDYHRRHKVCEMHSKSPEVTIGGHKQRFCQQCSRFHSLEEFDEGKRSCRKRLDGHNRRRRKPQQEPLARSGCILSNCQGTRLFPLSSPEVYPTTALVNPIWAGVVETKQEAKLYNEHLQVCLHDKQNPYPGSSSISYRGEGKQFSFLSNQTVPEASESGGPSREIFSDGLSTQGLDSNCALSLLSSSLIQTSQVSLSHMVAPASIPLARPLGPILQYNGLDRIDSDVVPSAGDTDVHCQGVFHTGRDLPSQNEASQALPFCWE